LGSGLAHYHFDNKKDLTLTRGVRVLGRNTPFDLALPVWLKITTICHSAFKNAMQISNYLHGL
jgi:hypothetical protein